MTRPRRVLAHACAVPLAVAAGVRIRRLERSTTLDELARRLRGGARLQGAAADPAALAHVVWRLAPVLPPWGMGLCLKRSLLLLDLWSRCGLQPRLHLGIHADRRGHAWVSAGPLAAGTADGSAEVAAL